MLRKRNFGVICGYYCSVGWHNTIMSKILKIRMSPKSLNAMGSEENQSESFCADWLKIEGFKDWLEPMEDNPYKAWCSVCNVTLDCSRIGLSKHAGSSEHQTSLQHSGKRKLVIGQIMGKVSMVNSSGSTDQPRKIIFLQRKMNPNIQCEVVTEEAGENSEEDPHPNVIPSVPTMKKIDMQLLQQRKDKSFCLEWLDVPEFKDWLSPDPGNPYKAHCLACNTILKAGKSELVKHASGAKHEKAVEALKNMVLEQQAWDEAQVIDEDEEDDYDTRVNTGTQILLTGEQQHEQKQQLEVLNTIASSVTRLATAAAGALESLARNQETLNNILMHLVNK